MTTEELAELLRTLLAKGITVFVLVAGPSGPVVGQLPGADAPPASSGPTTPGDSAEPNDAVEPGDAVEPERAPRPRPDRPDPGSGDRPADPARGPSAPAGPDAAGAAPDPGGARDRVRTVEPDGTWSGGAAPGDGGHTDTESDAGAGDAAGDPNDMAGGRDDTAGKPSDTAGGAAGGGSPSGDGTGDTAGGSADRDGAPGPGYRESSERHGTHPETGGDQMTANAGVTAAETLGWGDPVRSDDFTDGTGGWNIYDGPGHAGNGRRTPDAVSVRDGLLTITGDPAGNTAGMAWMPGQKYGRWEGRVRAPASDPSYNALLLLWPDAEDFPVGGEVDFMEMMDHTRQTTNLFLHYGADNSQVGGDVEIDGTAWHNWAVEWTPRGISAFVDGERWWQTTDASILPPGPMHLCIQLDWFPDNGGGDVAESIMQVDWVKQYALDGAERR